MTRLPAAAWTKRDDLAQLVSALGHGTIRWVGGAVRDTLLRQPVADIDAASTHHPEAVIALCKTAGIRTVPTGIAHGTVTALLAGGKVEVTTLRHDVSTDGRRATVAFADDWQDDAARRDFTINALYADPVSLEVFDYFGGVADLADKRVRFIGDARQRIAEDHLRILRYFRFQARFGGLLDDEAQSACSDMVHTLKGLSRERVAMELLGILALPDPLGAVSSMAELGVLAVVLPEATVAPLVSLVAAETAFAIAPLALRRMAALLPAEPLVAEKVAARLKLSTAQRKHLSACAARMADDTANPRALAYRLGNDVARDRLLLAGADPAPVIGWTVPQLPLKGGEIVERGLSAGPDVARILKAVERRWIAEGFPPRIRVEQLLAEEMGRGPNAPA
jgi:poly(A) polymerase